MILKRIKTGIPGLDDLIQGGFPRGFCVLVSGSPGTGKTIFGVQYLAEGAKNGEKGLYATFEQKVDDLMLQAEIFEWDLVRLMDKGMLRIISLDIEELNLAEITTEIMRGGYNRVVIDSLTSLIPSSILFGKVSSKDVLTTRKFIHEIINQLKQSASTSILTSEVIGGSLGLSSDGMSEFLVDGVITLHYGTGEQCRTMRIQKMRATRHSENIHPIQFEEGIGIKVITL